MRAREFLTEAATSVLFQYSNADTAAGILEQGYFDLENALGNSSEESYMPPGKPYFFSTTRSRLGDYHRHPTQNSVLFTLDGDYLNDRYTVKAIDYFDRMWLAAPLERGRESEDRVYSKKPTIPVLPMVKQIDVYLMWDRKQSNDERWSQFRSDELRRIITAARNLGIPVTYYKSQRGWQSRAPGDRVDEKTVLDSLLPPPHREPRERRTYAQHIEAWLELIEKDSLAELSKEADRIRYNYIMYSGFDKGDVQLRNDLHNARPGTAEYPIAVKLVNWMVANRIKTTTELHKYLKQKWDRIYKQEHGAKKSGELDESVDEEYFQYRKPIDAVTKAGYKIRINPFDERLQVKVYDKGILIAEFLFGLTPDGQHAYSENTWVHEPYRRQGLATEIYNIVHNLGTGIDIAPSEKQTPDGQKLWGKLGSLKK